MGQISKSQFKAKALELFREVETTGRPLIITDRGQPTLEIRRYQPRTTEEILEELKDSVLFYDHPFEPVGLDDWEALK
jgi:PHD/YefM family antitoxin component YafN of YafNO toxin-antitoxin module